MTTETTRYRFDAAILGKETRGQKVAVKLDWKLPGAKYELLLYLASDDSRSLNVGDRLHWSITRGSLGNDRAGKEKSGQYPSDYFWDLDKDDTAATQPSRNSPTVYEDEEERSMEEDFVPQGDPRAMEPQGRAERSNTGEKDWDAITAAKDHSINLSAARRDAMIAIQIGEWPVPEGRTLTSWVRECSARLFYFHHAREIEPRAWCYVHEKARNQGSNGYGHPVEGGSCVWEKGVVPDQPVEDHLKDELPF